VEVVRQHHCVNNVSLTIADGEFLALLGPSGSGKTTLLRVLAGLDFVDAGSITLDGRSVDGVPARERSVGFVFQHYALFRHMTIMRNVAFGLSVRPRSRRPSAAVIRERVQLLLDLMEIGGLAHRYPERISGGQRQRVALARALATEPRLLLLDEPFGALDAKVRRNLRVWLRGLHDRLGLTSIFVTHDQAEAMEMADRVAILRAGRIEQVDTPDLLYAQPASTFVHEFLGESIRLNCTIRHGFAQFDGLSLAAVPTGCPSGPAHALVRPHEIGLTPGPGPALVMSVHARVRLNLAGQILEVIQHNDDPMPAVGQSCAIDVSTATIYPQTGPGMHDACDTSAQTWSLD
jgi:sulfate transport system ATP-binding protein